MLHDKNKEIDGLNKEFQRQIQILVEDHKKEVDVSIRCVVFIDKIWSVYLTLAKFLSLTKFNLYNKYAIMIVAFVLATPMVCFVVVFFKTMYNKTIIRFDFCNILNNQGLEKCYQPRPSARPITLTLTLITKTSSNNC